MKVKSEQYGSLLIPIIMAKLSDEIRIQVKRKYVSRRLGDRLLDHIQSEIETREMSQKIKITAEQVKGPSFPATDSRNFFGGFQTESTVPTFTALNDISQHLAAR